MKIARFFCCFSLKKHQGQNVRKKFSLVNAASCQLNRGIDGGGGGDTFVNQNTSINPEAFAFGPTNIKSVFHFTQLSAREVGNVLKSLPNKLSTGSDGISYQLLKEAGPGIVGPLTTLFNRSISLGQVPDEWKHAIVSPIYKGGRKDKRSPTNYRPISLTSCVARTMEKLLHCQVLEYLQTNGLLYEHQAGFLPNHSTVTQLYFLTHKWQMMLDREGTPCPNCISGSQQGL